MSVTSAPVRRGGVTVEDGSSSDDDFEVVNNRSNNRSSSSSSSSSQSNRPAARTSVSPPSNNLSPENTSDTLRPLADSPFEIWLRVYVNEPLLSITPVWVTPNSLSFLNSFVCWAAFFVSYIASRYDKRLYDQNLNAYCNAHIVIVSLRCAALSSFSYRQSELLYPYPCFMLRVLMALFVFMSAVLDCLDGMQARKTGQCSALGEVLDHSLDAANVPLTACCVLMMIQTDCYTIMISLIGGSMIYNSQLIIYYHHHMFINPPIAGATAQSAASLVIISFALFFLFCDRQNAIVQALIIIFTSIGNLVQVQNTFFFLNHIRHSFETSCLVPHLRFGVVFCLHALLLLGGFITNAEYLFAFPVFAYRLNGKYVLKTLAEFKPFSSTHTKEMVRARDVEWAWDCIIGVSILLTIAILTGVDAQNVAPSITGLPFIGDSLFHVCHYIFLAACIGANVYEVKQALPKLAANKK